MSRPKEEILGFRDGGHQKDRPRKTDGGGDDRCLRFCTSLLSGEGCDKENNSSTATNPIPAPSKATHSSAVAIQVHAAYIAGSRLPPLSIEETEAIRFLVATFPCPPLTFHPRKRPKDCFFSPRKPESNANYATISYQTTATTN